MRGVWWPGGCAHLAMLGILSSFISPRPRRLQPPSAAQSSNLTATTGDGCGARTCTRGMCLYVTGSRRPRDSQQFPICLESPLLTRAGPIPGDVSPCLDDKAQHTSIGYPVSGILAISSAPVANKSHAHAVRDCAIARMRATRSIGVSCKGLFILRACQPAHGRSVHALLFSVDVLPRLKDLIDLGASHPLPVKYRGHGKVAGQGGRWATLC